MSFIGKPSQNDVPDSGQAPGKPGSGRGLGARPVLRWLVPAVAAVTVIGGGAAVGKFAAQADPSLPARSAAQLLVDMQTARLDGLSGTVVQTADLGLPKLPAVSGQLGLGMASLLSGSNTLRVWYSGPDKARLALVNTYGEIDLIRNGTDAWLWDSQANSAQHYRIRESADDREAPPMAVPTGVPGSPKEVAELALSAIDPTTEVTTDGSAKVAGRNAYELVLKPRDKSSLVGQVRVAIDATEHVPLRVEVFPTGSDDTAFEVAFTQVSFDRPDAQRFSFNPPPGAKVEDKTADQAKAEEKAEAEAGELAKEAERAHAGSTVVGKGWTAVLVARLSDGATGGKDGASAGDLEQGLSMVPGLRKVSGAWGSGRLLGGRLFSALLTDDGRVLVGAVSPERLYQVAGSAEGKVK